MTLKSFLKALSETPRQWKMVAGNIRFFPKKSYNRLHDCCCPITAVHPKQWGANLVSVAAKELGLSNLIQHRIIRAADLVNYNREDLTQVNLRKQLLKACGLEHLK